jgi:hypothetical protein
MPRRYWIVLAVVAVAVAAAGGAFAATKLESPGASSKAVINDAAGRLHVSPGALSSALRKALDDQIDAAVAAGRLTKQQGDMLKARIDSGRAPLLGGFGLPFHPHRFGPGFGMWMPGMLGLGLRAVTTYLGITPAQLRSALFSGKNLGQIAKAHGKTADGLVAALTALAKSRLDRAVSSGHLSTQQESAILSHLQTLFRKVVAGKPALPMLHRPPFFGFGFGFRHQLGMPPMGWRSHFGRPMLARPRF